ncbi:hypothetical protein SAMN04488096_107159 [Mesonia phycicola]|uniref:MetA-pathway of phenol degradation n=1 Tax=Mesonia phycicola TaxID=579105 RepID=A0A1M6G652_9FLAO|nr:DUF6588 family protein [Mesonia phycicola]SHJ05458.1 hypothetical protein SAMN04488096_107159 [Mesonia phycicola]
MKKFFSVFVFIVVSTVQAQDNIQAILRAGVDDATKFSENYIAPASEAAIYSLANGWYNSAKAKETLHFEISVVANVGLVSEKNQSFNLNIDDYNYISFADGSQSKNVATVFGENNPDQIVIVEYETSNGTETTSFTLPQGLGGSNIDFFPTAYLQGSLGLGKGFEVKARFLPEVDYDGAKTKFYGGAIQHEFTSWLGVKKILPVAISGLIGYNRLEASYLLDDNSLIQGSNQKIKTEMNSWIYSAIVSTKLPVINFYAGLGYVTGDATSTLDGTYVIDEGPIQGEVLINPYTVTNNVSGLNATLGFKLKLAFFRLNASYSFQEYQNINLGLNFGY